MSYIYLASPYSAPEPETMQWRYNEVVKWIADHVRIYSNPVVYSPIVHFHNVVTDYNLPGGVDFWWPQNKGMIDSASALWVLQLPGWDKSVGVKKETQYARSLRKRVKYVK